MVLHGLKYFFPLIKTRKGTGIITSYAAPCFRNEFPPDTCQPVWLTDLSDDEGIGIKPLYQQLPDALIKNWDNDFYAILSSIDAVRGERC